MITNHLTRILRSCRPFSNWAQPKGLVRGAQNSLSKTESKYILSETFLRRDGNRVLLEGRLNEINLWDFFNGQSGIDEQNRFASDILSDNIINKRILVVPGYSTNAFLFKHLGAAEVVGADVDPVSIAWLKAIRDYYHANEVGRLLMSSANYPNRKEAIDYQMSANKGEGLEKELAQMIKAAMIHNNTSSPLTGITFLSASLGPSPDMAIPRVSCLPEKDNGFDFIYIPFLLGIDQGITDRNAVKAAFEDLWQVARPGARIMITPFTATEYDQIGSFGPKDIIENLQLLMPKDKFRVIRLFPIGAGLSAILEAIK